MFLRPRVLVQLPLGFGSGLPYPLTGSTLVARLGSAGVAIDVIALFALLPTSGWAGLSRRRPS